MTERSLTRRALLTAGGLAGGALVAGVLVADDGSPSARTSSSVVPARPDAPPPHWPDPLPRIAAFPVDAGRRAQFAPDEQVLGAYAATLPELTAAIATDRRRYGWMAGGFWRQPSRPDNARIQENVITLAWFYTQDRPWNPYYRSPELLRLLDATVSYYLSLQHRRGWFPEGSGRTPRAATAFALVHLAATWRLMASVEWNPGLSNDVLAAVRRGADWFLDPANDDVWESAIYTSNQVLEGLYGVALIADRTGTERDRLLNDRIEVFLARSISPAGFLYEDRALDFGYPMSVTLGDLGLMHRLTGDDRLLEPARRFFDFCSYNYLWEPDGAGFVVNGAIGARLTIGVLDADRPDDTSTTDLLATLRDELPQTDAFLSTAQGKAAFRAAWAADPQPIPVLGPGRVNPVRPRTVSAQPQFPARARRLRAVDTFRYRRETDFVEQRHDEEFDQHFGWIRRPDYLFGAAWGTPQGRQRFGPGYLYHPRAGTFVCAQHTPGLGWGVRSGGYDESATALTGSVGADGDDPDLVLREPAGLSTRTLVCRSDRFEVALDSNGVFDERIPLILRPSDLLEWVVADGGYAPVGADTTTATVLGLTIRRRDWQWQLRTDRLTELTLERSELPLFRSGLRQVRALRISATDQLTYDVRFLG